MAIELDAVRGEDDRMIRTATETLMSAMTEFGQTEPRDCIVIWTNEAGDICWSSSTDSQLIKIGMVEMLRTILKKRVDY